MSALLAWIFLHAEWLLVGNLVAGAYALLAYLPALDLEAALRSPLVRLLVLVLLAVLGLPLLGALAIAERLHRRGLYYPPPSRRRR